MPLEPEQYAKADAWLNKYLKGKPCPVCAKSSWIIHDAVNGLTDITGGVLPTAGHVTMYGVVIFRCATCSHIVCVAAHPIGIEVGQRTSPPPEQQPSAPRSTRKGPGR
jgi:hypothetical protein